MYLHERRGQITLVYVDDGLMYASKSEDIQFAKDVLRNCYELSNIGEASYTVEIRIKMREKEIPGLKNQISAGEN